MDVLEWFMWRKYLAWSQELHAFCNLETVADQILQRQDSLI